MLAGKWGRRKAGAALRRAGATSALACGTPVTWPACIARSMFRSARTGPRTTPGCARYEMRRAGPAAPNPQMSMTVIALVLAANLLLAGLFSLVAIAVD